MLQGRGYFEDVGASWVFGWFFAGAWWPVGSLVGTGQFVFDWFLASAGTWCEVLDGR